MTAPRFTIRHDGRPAVELQDTAGGILVTTFSRPRTLTPVEAVSLHAELGKMIAVRAEQDAARAKSGAGA